MDKFQKIELLKQELNQAEKEKNEAMLTIRSLKNEIRKAEHEQMSNEESASALEYEVENMLRQSKNFDMRREDRWETRQADEYRLKARRSEYHIERLCDSEYDEQRKISQLNQKIDKIKSEINAIDYQNQSSRGGNDKPSTSKSSQM